MPPSPTRPLIALALAALMAGLPVASPAADGSAGAYLAARVAASENDFREAALWYDRLIDTGHADPALLEGAIIAHLSLGEVATHGVGGVLRLLRASAELEGDVAVTFLGTLASDTKGRPM